jgi:hypothetical protein
VLRIILDRPLSDGLVFQLAILYIRRIDFFFLREYSPFSVRCESVLCAFGIVVGIILRYCVADGSFQIYSYLSYITC